MSDFAGNEVVPTRTTGGAAEPQGDAGFDAWWQEQRHHWKSDDDLEQLARAARASVLDEAHAYIVALDQERAALREWVVACASAYYEQGGRHWSHGMEGMSHAPNEGHTQCDLCVDAFLLAHGGKP
jgi:hypothetical protein